jgi:hypothetical protein
VVIAVSIVPYSCALCKIWIANVDCRLFDVFFESLIYSQSGPYMNCYRGGTAVGKCHFVHVFVCVCMLVLRGRFLIIIYP